MEEQCAHPGKKQGGLDVQGQIVGAGDDDGDQDGGAEHGKHVLDAQDKHLGYAELPRVSNGFCVVFHLIFSLHMLRPERGKKRDDHDVTAR